MKTVTYTIPNISCKHCTHTIAMELSEIEGVSKVDADVNTKQVTIAYDEPASQDAIKQLLRDINYPAD
jgi:copper chaperone CopZ